MAPQTTTKYIDFQNLLNRGDNALIVIKLMMACNDLQLTNEALFEWKKDQPNLRKDRQLGAKMYFIRMQMAHLHEGLKIMQEIRNNNDLMNLVRQCDARTQEAFQNIEKVLPGGSDHNKFKKYLIPIRQNLAFHYNQSGKLIQKALSDRASRPELQFSSLTRGDTAYLWHFKVADDIINSIVVRQIWGIPKTADLLVEADNIVEYLYHIFLCFIDFSGEFIWKYSESN
jgi:hypothetical protein